MNTLLIMFELMCLITFTNPDATNKKVLVRKVADISIKKGVSNLTNTCHITLPKNLLLPKNKKLEDVFQKGNKVEVLLGYGSADNLEFEGYVRSVKHDIPVEIICEDEMYKLKQMTLKPKAFKNAKLEEVIRYVLQGTDYKFEVIDTVVDDFTVQANVSPALVFQYLKQKLGITFNFKDKNTLKAGFPYDFKPNKKMFVARFQQNVAGNNLEYINRDGINIKLIGISHVKGQKPIKVEYNPNQLLDKDSETRTKNFRNLTEAQLKEALKNEYDRIQTEGYRGSITLFGKPFTQPSDAIVLEDTNFPDRKGTYLIDDIEVQFGTGGYRRVHKISKRIE